SHARTKDEAELAPSPLIAAIALSSVDELGVGRFRTLRDAIRDAGAIEIAQDALAPPPAAAIGGTGLFKDQAACPFRAFAARRLCADPLETPRPGIDLRDRGSLVHETLKTAWRSLETRDRLLAASEQDLATLLV